MKKKGEKIIGGLHFIPFSTMLREQLRKPGFKKAFLAEMARENLAFDLKTLRIKKKMSQKQVATKAEMPQSVIARMESGRHSASITTLQKIAVVFGKRVGLVEQTLKRR